MSVRHSGRTLPKYCIISGIGLGVKDMGAISWESKEDHGGFLPYFSLHLFKYHTQRKRSSLGAKRYHNGMGIQTGAEDPMPLSSMRATLFFVYFTCRVLSFM